MAFLGLLVFVALMIPVVVVLVDSPIGRALARRLEGPEATPPALAELARKVEVLETEVSELTRTLESLREENRFLQQLIEGPDRPRLPPRPGS
jgi:predicted RNase H-like nuclease (RuvC/YqgF family)